VRERETTGVEEQAELFGVLADPTRLKLLRLLSQQKEPNALCVNALAYQIGITQSAVSQHLKLLKSAGLVKGKKRGYRIHYFINQEAIIQAEKKMFSALPIEEKNTHQHNSK